MIWVFYPFYKLCLQQPFWGVSWMTCIIGRGFLTPYFMKTPPSPILPSPLSSNFVHFHHFLVASKLYPRLLPLLNCFLDYVGDRAKFDVILLNDSMVLHMKSLSTLVLERSSCVFYAKTPQVYWRQGLTHNLLFCWCSDLMYQGPIDYDTNINIY